MVDVLQETLRLHPIVYNLWRVAGRDDVIPLSAPLTLPNGDVTDRVAVAEGQEVLVPIDFMNTATAFWGADAREWRPERWLEDPENAKVMERYMFQVCNIIISYHDH